MRCPKTSDEWVRYRDAAERTGIPLNTILVWAHRGKIETKRLGRREVWVNLDDVLHAERDRRHHLAARAA